MTDRLLEEKKRGITIELGFTPLRLEDGRVVSVIDVPGHEHFIRQTKENRHSYFPGNCYHRRSLAGFAIASSCLRQVD